MNKLLLISMTICLGSCGSYFPANAQSEADEIKARIGRYQLIEARAPYPALILDTVTGCVEALIVVPEGGAQATFDPIKLPDGRELAPPPAIVPASRAGQVMRAGVIGQSREQCQVPRSSEGEKKSSK